MHIQANAIKLTVDVMTLNQQFAMLHARINELQASTTTQTSASSTMAVLLPTGEACDDDDDNEQSTHCLEALEQRIHALEISSQAAKLHLTKMS